MELYKITTHPDKIYYMVKNIKVINNIDIVKSILYSFCQECYSGEWLITFRTQINVLGASKNSAFLETPI